MATRCDDLRTRRSSLRASTFATLRAPMRGPAITLPTNGLCCYMLPIASLEVLCVNTDDVPLPLTDRLPLVLALDLATDMLLLLSAFKDAPTDWSLSWPSSACRCMSSH